MAGYGSDDRWRVEKPAGDPFTPTERTLVDDLAGQAGLVLHNVR